LSEDRAFAHLSPSWQDRDVLQSIADALKGLKTMTDALAAEQCVTVSAVKPLLNHITEEVLVAEDDDIDLTKEMKKRIARYDDPEFSFLLELSSFLDPRFKLNYVSNRADVLEKVEKKMRELNDGSVNDAPSTDNSGMAAPPTKRAKGLSKVLGHCLGSSQSVQLTPHQQIKQELDQYLSHPQLDVEASPHLTGGK